MKTRLITALALLASANLLGCSGSTPSSVGGSAPRDVAPATGKASNQPSVSQEMAPAEPKLAPAKTASRAAEQEATETKSEAFVYTKSKDGWLQLFDGQTTSGWKTEGEVKVVNGMLTVGGDKPASIQTIGEFEAFELQFQYPGTDIKGIKLVLNKAGYDLHELPSQIDAAGGTIAGPGSGSPPAYEQKGLTQSRWKVRSDTKSHEVSATSEFEMTGLVQGKITAQLEPSTKEGKSQTSITFKVPAATRLALQEIKLRPLTRK